MGIKNFTSTFKPTFEVGSFDEAVLHTLFPQAKHKYLRLAIDGSTELIRFFKISDAKVNEHGHWVHHELLVLKQIKKRHSLNIREIWVFDPTILGLQRTALKTEEVRIRKESQRKQLEKFTNACKESQREQLGKNTNACKESQKNTSDNALSILRQNELKRLETNSRVVTNSLFWRFIQNVLEPLQIPWIVAPEHEEGEKVCAQLCSQGVVDVVLSGDTDVMPFGSPNLLFRLCSKKKRGYWAFFCKEDILKQQKPIQSDFAKFVWACIGLKCDFCDKIPLVGPKSLEKAFLKPKCNINEHQNHPLCKKYTFLKDFVSATSCSDNQIVAFLKAFEYFLTKVRLNFDVVENMLQTSSSYCSTEFQKNAEELLSKLSTHVVSFSSPYVFTEALDNLDQFKFQTAKN